MLYYCLFIFQKSPLFIFFQRSSVILLDDDGVNKLIIMASFILSSETNRK